MLRSLWQEHSAALHAMLKGWCGDAQNASDILQEVFRRLAESPAVMTRVKNARAFLAVSARRIAVDFARRSKTRSDYQTAAGEETPTAENPGPTDENLRAVIAEALNSLPAEQRSVFEHKILNGRTLEEISRLEGVSLNTVASRLRYALNKIRGQLRPYYDDLNRKDFKIMKNDPSNTEDIASRRIITPLAPKRVPSVAPGLEGLAAMAPDACEAAPEIEVSAPEFVEAAPAVEFLEPEVANCGVGGNAWEQSIPEAVELPAIDGEGSPSEAAEDSEEVVVTEEIPEMISCEVLPEGGIPEEWLRPIWVFESPENLLTSLFEGESDLDADGNGGGEAVDGEGVPFVLESGFEICVLPVPENFSVDIDPNELLLRYNEFLRENPDWGALDPDMMEIQVVTPSSYFGELEFGTPSKAASFDSWYERLYVQSNDGDDADGSGTIMVTRPDGSEYGTIVRDPNLSGVGGIPAEWMRGGTDQAGILYSTSGGIGAVPGTGLALSGGVSQGVGVPTLGEASQTVVTGGTLVTNEPVEHVGDNTLTLSNGSKIVLEGGQVISNGNVYGFSPEVGSDNEVPDTETLAEVAGLPTEVAITDTSAAEVALSFGNAAAGLAPTSGEALIVEFGVLSPSEAPHAPQVSTLSRPTDDLPQANSSSGGSTFAAINPQGLSSAQGVSAPDDALQHVTASAQQSAPASSSGIKIDAPTATAGAVAAGTVVHGGAAAPVIRRPLFKA